MGEGLRKGTSGGKGIRHGRSEGKRGVRKPAEEGGSNGARERSKEGAWEEGR